MTNKPISGLCVAIHARGYACGFIALLFLAFTSASSFAATYAEQGDAGDLPLSAQIASGAPATPLTAITGTLTLNLGISEGDMYQIFISNPATFSATTTGFAPGVNNFDTQLFLFNAAGLGVAANDDDATSGGPQSTFAAGDPVLTSLPAGVYYILITGSGRYPVDSLNHLIFPNFTDGTTDPTKTYSANPSTLAVAGYTGNSNEGGNYSIALTGAQFVVVPEPSAALLVLITGAGALILNRRRSKTRPLA